MSHFTVLVIGKNPEQQLAPYDENNDAEQPRWDWYLLGGRWTGYFQINAKPRFPRDVAIGEPGIMTKPAKPGRADRARKVDINIDAMRTAARQAAQALWLRYESATAGLEPAPRWQEVRERHGNDVDAARAEYNAHPWIKALHKAELMPLFGEPRDDYDGMDSMVARAERNALVTHAVVKDGQWYENGIMGWFGMVRDEKAEEQWSAEFTKLFDALPEDTLLSLYDCHI